MVVRVKLVNDFVEGTLPQKFLDMPFKNNFFNFRINCFCSV